MTTSVVQSIWSMIYLSQVFLSLGVLCNKYIFFWYSIIILLYKFFVFLLDIYIPLGISLSCSFVIVSELFCGELFDTYKVIFAILLPISLTVASAVFWYSIIILLYYSQYINNFMYFFWRYTSFLRYFFIMFICNYFWVILW